MESNSLPILMVADSSLLYLRKPTGKTWLHEMIKIVLSSNQISSSKCSAFDRLTSCYIGVNNGDEEAFFEIFQGAITAAGLDSKNCHFIKSSFSSSELEILSKADVIFVSGGNPVAGWNVFKNNQLVISLILERHRRGELVLIGSSAGAMQMGFHIYSEEAQQLIPTFQLVPAIFGMHEDGAKGGYWNSFTSVVSQIHKNHFHQLKGERLLGLCWSGALLYYPQSNQFVPINKDLIEFSYDASKDQVTQTTIPCQK